MSEMDDGPQTLDFHCALCGSKVQEWVEEFPEEAEFWERERICPVCNEAGHTVLLGLTNRAMARKLATGQAMDLSGCERTPLGEYVIPKALWLRAQDQDLCDALREAWIWSVGQSEESGRILAATDARFYQAEGWTCLWLR